MEAILATGTTWAENELSAMVVCLGSIVNELFCIPLFPWINDFVPKVDSAPWAAPNQTPFSWVF